MCVIFLFPTLWHRGTFCGWGFLSGSWFIYRFWNYRYYRGVECFDVLKTIFTKISRCLVIIWVESSWKMLHFAVCFMKLHWVLSEILRSLSVKVTGLNSKQLKISRGPICKIINYSNAWSRGCGFNSRPSRHLVSLYWSSSCERFVAASWNPRLISVRDRDSNHPKSALSKVLYHGNGAI
jgi:hypothetical protein